jgi:agmatinase
MVERVVAVGIRAMDRSELMNVDSQRIFFAEHLRLTPNWIDNVLAQLTDEVYITLDVDVFDIGIMPSTGTPEPGGLGWYDVITLLRAVVEHKNVVGFDIVELAPNEANPAPDFMAAKVVYKLLSYREALRESAV